MATLTTKFSVGDRVFSAGTTIVRKQRPCPDCMGSKKWKATSPAGVDYEFSCPRCSPLYRSHQEISLDYSAHAPLVQSLTIGQVRVQAGADPEVRYMCQETGVGSGQLWDETDLYATREEAEAAAEALAKARDEETPWVKKLFEGSLRLSDYELSNAVKKAAEDSMLMQGVRFQMLCEDLRDCQSNDDIKEAFDRYSERVKELAA